MHLAQMMLSDLKQYFYNPVCFKCGSLFVEPHLFCEVCFDFEIRPRMFLKHRVIEFENMVLQHFYLFDWFPGESDLLSSMIYQIKSDRCAKALKFYAAQAAQELSYQWNKQSQFNCILPLPGSKKNSYHSQILAQALSKRLKLPQEPIFKKEDIGFQQKDLDSSARRKVRAQINTERLSELFTNLHTDKLSPIYIDDVLTTGSTLKASIRALGTAEEACVLTLFYRTTNLEKV